MNKEQIMYVIFVAFMTFVSIMYINFNNIELLIMLRIYELLILSFLMSGLFEVYKSAKNKYIMQYMKHVIEQPIVIIGFIISVINIFMIGDMLSSIILLILMVWLHIGINNKISIITTEKENKL